MTAFGRREFLGATAGAAALAGLVACATTDSADNGATSSVSAQGSPSGVTLRWWGNNSWEIRLPEGKTVLIDPWLTRFHTGTYTAEGADPRTPITVNTALIDHYVDSGELRADHILVTHGHYDHISDVPYLAKKTGATVLGTETHLNLMAALGAPEQQLALATGGEFLRFDGYTIRVLRSLHSASGPRATVAFAGTRPGFGTKELPEPKVIRDLVEGGTLAYQVSGGGVGVLNFGGSNYIESELAGLRPDVLLLPAGGGKIQDYVGRLLRATGNPRYVLPTHWDDFDHPLTEPARDWGGLETLRAAVLAASPQSAFVTVDHLQTFQP
ncbi:MBL fold metallo-hydrolase [Nocardia araoensis]|uniref:MBL fold metallo-hydrolase n=1 Tax=Nocardia araoensis TaxID=228600 RepID=UPI0002E86490|nr:MBL fold metallo-hydrolase [Nocardia araoensis]